MISSANSHDRSLCHVILLQWYVAISLACYFILRISVRMIHIKRYSTALILLTYLSFWQNAGLWDHHTGCVTVPVCMCVCARAPVCLFVCVCVSVCHSFRLLKQLTDFRRTRYVCYAPWGHLKRRTFYFPVPAKNDLENARTCEVEPKLNLDSLNYIW
jgi:hypothetical protein